MRFFALIAIALTATSVEAAAVHNQAHAKMHGPHTKTQLAQVKGQRAASHGPLEKPMSLAQTKAHAKAKNQAKLKNRNRNKMSAKAKTFSKGKDQWGEDIDWDNVADRGIAAYNAAFR